MRIEYDPEADALYIRFRDGKPVEATDPEDGVTLDLDAKKRLIGIEILDVKHRFPPETLATITVQNLVAQKSGDGAFKFLEDEPDLYREKDLQRR